MRRLYWLVGLLAGIALALIQNQGWRDVRFGLNQSELVNLERNLSYAMAGKLNH